MYERHARCNSQPCHRVGRSKSASGSHRSAPRLPFRLFRLFDITLDPYTPRGFQVRLGAARRGLGTSDIPRQPEETRLFSNGFPSRKIARHSSINGRRDETHSSIPASPSLKKNRYIPKSLDEKISRASGQICADYCGNWCQWTRRRRSFSLFHRLFRCLRSTISILSFSLAPVSSRFAPRLFPQARPAPTLARLLTA